MKLYKYNNYAEYVEFQKKANLNKLDAVFVDEKIIQLIKRFLRIKKAKVKNIICHGTRNGAEQKFFKKNFKGVDVLGTEIGDTAEQFEDTIQWDFHDMKPEWKNYFCLLYSNSFDHAYNPAMMFRSWLQQIRPGGYMVLEHCGKHASQAATEIDPFSVTVRGLIEYVKKISGNGTRYDGKIELKDSRLTTILFWKKAL